MSGEENEIEKICGFRIRGGEKQFHVKWKGYDLEDNSWYAESEIANEFIEEYAKDHQEEMDKIIRDAEHPSENEDQSNTYKPSDDQKETDDEEDDEPKKKGKKEKKEKKEKKDTKEKKPKKEKEVKPKKEKTKKKKSVQKIDKEKGNVIGFFSHKNKNYYTIETKNGEVKDVRSREARTRYPEKIIAYLESQLPE